MTRIGWIGTGVMGSSMCGHLLAAGHEVTVTTRTRPKADALVDAGATWADSPAAVATASDVVFVMVGYPQEVEEVVLGALGALAPGALLVDMTTSRPALAVEIAERATQRGVAALDAPVSGGDVGARNGTLSIMVGGDVDAFARARPLFDLMGATVVHQGPAGAGQHTKLTNQVLVAGNIVAVCEALLYATRAGLDVESVLASVSSGAAASWALSNLAPRIVAGDYAPGVLRRPLREGHGDRARRSGAAAARAARALARAPALRRAPGAGTRSRRHAVAHPRVGRPSHQKRRHPSDAIEISSRISAVRSG